MKAKDLAAFLLKHPDATVNIPSLAEDVLSTPLREEDLRIRTYADGVVIAIHNERTLEG